MATIVDVPEAATESIDAESRLWLDRLRAHGPERDEAVGELHDLLLRAARFEISRRRAQLPHLRGDDFDDLAHHAAGDALVAILRKLDDFRGDSRFTTWAYKFALLEAAVVLRRRAWQGRELPLTDERWDLLTVSGPTPGGRAESIAALAAIQDAIANVLTAHQRDVLVSCVLNEVPIDVLAERRNTTRGALYKTLHDARRKLRAHLAAAGIDPLGVSDD
jgi:RNA polymerase sigma-70 factor (ECF subfamily)